MRRLVAGLSMAIACAIASPVSAEPAPPPEIVAPKQLTNDPVPYPQGASGDATVLLQLVVGKDGSVEEVKVIEGDEPFASAAKEVAEKYRFEPATRGGVPIRATIRARVVFKEPEKPVEATKPEEVKKAPEEEKKKPDAPVEILVEGERKEVATTTIGGGEVKILPGAFGDPFRAIESLPGVTPLINGLPFFYVRGAPPGNTGYLIDGVKVPMLFHLGAGPSVLAPGLVDHVDFHPGGYPARYGRFTGGIVAGETIGGPQKLHGEWNIRLFDASALGEQPVADGKGEALVAGRYGYPGLLLSLVSPDVSLAYWDYQVRAGYRPNDKDRISVFFFGAYDKLVDKKNDRVLFDTQFHRADLRWDRKIEGGSLRVATTLMFDQSGIDDGSTTDENGTHDSRFATRMFGFGVRGELEKKLDRVVHLRAGADVWLESYRLVGAGEAASSAPNDLFPTRADVLAGVRADAIVKPTDRVELVPGARIDVYAQGTTTVPAFDPRLSARLRVVPKVYSITTLGVTHQTPSFLVPAPGLRVATLGNGLQEAYQMAQGVELELPQKQRLTVTGFHNAFRKLNDALSVCLTESGKDCTIDTRVPGRSYGLEVLFKRDLTQRIGGWIAYTLSRSERTFDGKTFLSSFDRPHVFSAAASANLGAGFRFGARFAYMSGRPAEQRFSFVGPAAPGSDTETSVSIPVARVRLPAFHRLDLRLEKRWTNVAVVLEWYNALLQEEAVDWNCSTRTLSCTPEVIGPVTIPSLGVEGNF